MSEKLKFSLLICFFFLLMIISICIIMKRWNRYSTFSNGTYKNAGQKLIFEIFFSKEEVSKETASKEKKKVRVLTPFLSECQSIAAPVLESGCKSRGFKDMSQIYLSLFTIKNETFS